MKKRLMLIAAMGCILLTGCTKIVDLSETENEVVTQYMSDIILDGTSYNTLVKEAEVQLLLNKEAEPFKEVKEIKDKTEDSKTSDKTTSDKNSSNKSNKDKEENTSTDKKTKKEESVQLFWSDIKKDFEVSYTKYELTDNYSSSENKYYEIGAKADEQLLVLHFNVKNLSGKTKKLDLVEEGLKYVIEASGQKIKPMLTLLMEDIQYINLNIDGKSTKKAVLVFAVSKDIDMTRAELVINRENKSTRFSLK